MIREVLVADDLALRLGGPADASKPRAELPVVHEVGVEERLQVRRALGVSDDVERRVDVVLVVIEEAAREEHARHVDVLVDARREERVHAEVLSRREDLLPPVSAAVE